MKTEDGWLTRQERGAWGVVFMAFLFGDIVYTVIGLRRGVPEAHPVAQQILGHGFGAMVLAKLTVVAAGCLLFLLGPYLIPGVRRRHRIVVPTTLAIWGTVLMIWNIEAVLGILDPIRIAIEYIEAVDLAMIFL